MHIGSRPCFLDEITTNLCTHLRRGQRKRFICPSCLDFKGFVSIILDVPKGSRFNSRDVSFGPTGELKISDTHNPLQPSLNFRDVSTLSEMHKNSIVKSLYLGISRAPQGKFDVIHKAFLKKHSVFAFESNFGIMNTK